MGLDTPWEASLFQDNTVLLSVESDLRATYIDFKTPWKPLSIIEAYRYLGCQVYIGIQPPWELSDYWRPKTWALGDHGYIYNWLWHSKDQGTEGLGSKSSH